MAVRQIGILGRGAFGTFLRERIESFGFAVVSWDKQMADNGDPLNDPLDAVLGSDAVIFAVPPKHYANALETYVPNMRPDAVIVDVCTVKMVTAQALRRVANGRPYLSSHPMFGPQSFVDKNNSLLGLQLVICEHTLDPGAYDSLIKLLSDHAGLDVVTMTPEEHDEAQAREQLLTQHIGCVMNRTGFALNERNIHTVSAGHFYRAMHIVGNDAELFKQAAELNPFWPRVLRQFELALAEHNLAMLNGTASH